MGLCRYEKWSTSSFLDFAQVVDGNVGTSSHEGYYATTPHSTSVGDNSISVEGVGMGKIAKVIRTVYTNGTNPKQYMDLYWTPPHYYDDQMYQGLVSEMFINTNNGEFASYQVVSFSHEVDEGNGNIRKYWNVKQVPGTRTYYGPYTFIGGVYTHKRKSTLQSSNIVAEDGTYPDNGVHTDGYWYVKIATISMCNYKKYTIGKDADFDPPEPDVWTSLGSGSVTLGSKPDGWGLTMTGTSAGYSVGNLISSRPEGVSSGIYYKSSGTKLTFYVGDYYDSVIKYNVSSDGSYNSYIKTGIMNYFDVRGSYIETVQAECGTLPDNGINGGYWYVKDTTVILPNLKARVDGALKTYSDGWVRINGALRQIDSMWTRINGVLKKL